MKISVKGQYAVYIMIDIAENERNGNVSIKDISEREKLSPKYSEQVANILCKAGLIKSHRGAQGGYRLSKSMDKYTLGAIIQAIEGEFSVDYINDTNNKAVNDFWIGLYDVINNYMDSITISDLIR